MLFKWDGLTALEPGVFSLTATRLQHRQAERIRMFVPALPPPLLLKLQRRHTWRGSSLCLSCCHFPVASQGCKFLPSEAETRVLTLRETNWSETCTLQRPLVKLKEARAEEDTSMALLLEEAGSLERWASSRSIVSSPQGLELTRSCESNLTLSTRSELKPLHKGFLISALLTFGVR